MVHIKAVTLTTCAHTISIHLPITNPSLDNTIKTERKVHSRTCHEVPEWEYRYSCTLSLTSALDGKTRYPLYRGLGGPQGLSGRVRNISLPIGMRSPDRPARKSRYADWAIAAQNETQILCIFPRSYPKTFQEHNEGSSSVRLVAVVYWKKLKVMGLKFSSAA